MKDVVGKRLMAWRIKAVLPHVRGRLLDVGCGTNELVRAYAGEGRGVDVYPWEGVDDVVEDTAKLPYNDESFDTVTIVAALNHIPNRDEVLREIHRVLRTGGRLIITMIPPTISRVWHFLRSPWDADQHERGMEDGEVYGMRPCEVHRLLMKTGFQPCYAKRFMLGVNRLTVAMRCPSPTSAACNVSASR